MKPFWESSTFWVNVGTIVVIIIGLPEVTNILPEWTYRYLLAVSAVINVILRFRTTDGITVTK